jgi:YVTN family beta-propeller protein
VTFNSTGTKAYVTNQFSQAVGIIDVSSNTQTASVPVAGNPFAVIVGPGDDVVWVTTTADSLFGIRASTGAITHRMSMPIISNGLAICDSLLYVSTRDVGTVTVVNTNRDSVVRVLPVGGAPQGIVIAPSKQELYIANENGSLQFWNLTSNTSNGSVAINGRGFGLAQSPADGRLYVTTLEGGEVQVIDPASHAKVDSFVVGGVVRRIAFNPGGTIATVANEDGWVDFLTAPGVPTGPAPPYSRVLLSGRPYSAAISAHGLVYVSLLDDRELAADTLPAFAFSSTVSVGDTPTEVAFNSTGTRAYVTNQFSQSVGIIDAATGQQTTTIPVAGNPFAVIVGPGDSVVWVTTTADSLFGIRVASGTITHRLHMPSISNGMAMRDTLLYVSTRDAGIVTEVNTKGDSALRTFAVGGEPQGIVLSASGTELYVANQSGVLQFWDVPNNRSIASMPLAGGGFGLAQDPANSRLYVTTLDGGQVQLFDPVTHAQLDFIAVGGIVRRIAFNASGSIAAVANEAGWVDFLH